jgi:hypothetical protein
MLTVRNRRSISTAVLAGVVAALAAACSSTATSTAASSSTATHPATASASPSAPTPAAEALAAYAAMWKDVTEASNTSDYQAAYLSDHLSGKALLTITDNLAAEKGQGVVAQGVPVLHPVVTTATATTAAITDCLDDRSWLQVYASTRKLVDDIPGGFRSTTATVSDINGTWKVTQLNTGAEGTCKITQ